jgi:uncharacterized protein YcbK (DUF882 family)
MWPGVESRDNARAAAHIVVLMPKPPNPPLGAAPWILARRGFLRGALAFSAAAAIAPARALAGLREERVLSFAHTHTGEHLSVAYFADGGYLTEGLARLQGFLRDFRTGEAHAIDPALFDLLHDLRLATSARGPFQVISAYRSSATNAALREHGTGVAGHSLHVEGRAIDIRLSDVKTGTLRDAAVELRRGGVGYYPTSDFVHLDTGRIRRW